MEDMDHIKKPSLLLSLTPFISLIFLMLYGIIVLKSEPQIILVFAIIITAFIGKYLGYSWEEMEDSMIESNKMVMQANFIIMIVGCLIGVWMGGGIVPGMIYYGLKIFTPNMFLLLLPIICAVISMSTGSSWTAAGTIGIAAMGIGLGLGIDPALTAGAVITGACFGDKMSPLSDTTNLSAGLMRVNLFEHIVHMLHTVLPGFIISIIIFGLLGNGYKGVIGNTGEINSILEILRVNFTISPWIFLAPLSVVLIIIFKVPAVPGMIGGTAIGVIFSMLQGFSLSDISTFLFYGFQISTGNAVVDSLLNRGGLMDMMGTISLVICAMAFGGIVQKIGCLNTIIETILRHCKSRGSIIFSNVVTCVAMNFLTADHYMAIVIPGQMYDSVYRKLNLHPKNLSRVLEDAGTLTSPFVPWSTCGAVYMATLGIGALQYGKYYFLGIIVPIISIVYGFTGFKLTKLDKNRPIASHI